ncbi:hypothetical protein RCZ04_08770 [Capnocytophaga sp. HP1101]
MNETTVIALSKAELPSWIASFTNNELFKTQHIVITLSEEEHWLKKDLKPLVALAEQHSQQHQKSLVVVNRELALEGLELTLHIAPTLQEAYDLIELDEIERDLWK